MSLILGTIVRQAIYIQDDYLSQILKQIKHYLALQTNIVLTDNQSVLRLESSRNLLPGSQGGAKNRFFITKNFAYLFSQWQKIYIQDQEDFQFLDLCYQCLMIIKQHLPNKISICIQIIEDLSRQNESSSNQLSLMDFVQNLQRQKEQQFSRRVNSNFKSLVSQTKMTALDVHMAQLKIQNLLYLSQHFYFYKNKLAAIRFLACNQEIPQGQFASFNGSSLAFLKELSIDKDFKVYCEKIIQKILLSTQAIQKGFQNKSYDRIVQTPNQTDQISQKQFRRQQHSLRRQPLRNANQQPQSKEYTIKPKGQKKPNKISVKSLLFQLRQTTSLKRLTMLITLATSVEIQEQKYRIRIQKEIQKKCKHFIKQNYATRYIKQSETKGTQHYMKPESISCSKQKIKQLSEFYHCLQAYFQNRSSNHNQNIKAQKLINPKSFQKSKNIHSNQHILNQKQILGLIAQKIQQQYYQ